MIVSILFLIGCICACIFIIPNRGNESNTQSTTNQNIITKTYSSILEEYKIKLKEATPILIEEYKKESINNTDGISGLAELSNEKILELAEISNAGMSEMAELMYTTGSGNYSEYQEWAGKLYKIYTEEAGKITQAYTDSVLN